MNKRELKKLQKLRDELKIMADAEQIKNENLGKVGASYDRLMKVKRAYVSLEMAVDCLDDLL